MNRKKIRHRTTVACTGGCGRTKTRCGDTILQLKMVSSCPKFQVLFSSLLTYIVHVSLYIVAAIQTNREKSASMHVLCSNGQAYIIDTAQGFQRNKEYGTEKLIKCVLEANVPAGTNISSASKNH